MQQNPHYNDVVKEVSDYIKEKVASCKDVGINHVIVDPGFGFGKSLQENHRLLQQLEHLHILGCPLLIGVSRKSMITKKLDISTEEALNGTSVLNTVAYLKGATVFRVHDIDAAKELIVLLEKE